jgi:hypothetical protein
VTFSTPTGVSNNVGGVVSKPSGNPSQLGDYVGEVTTCPNLIQRAILICEDRLCVTARVR